VTQNFKGADLSYAFMPIFTVKDGKIIVGFNTHIKNVDQTKDNNPFMAL
jgi:hypothetical protein